MKGKQTILIGTTAAILAFTLGTQAMAFGGKGGGYCDDRGMGSKQGKHFKRGGPMQRDPEVMLEKMTERLDLDENQQSQARNILTAGHETLSGLRDQMKENREKLRELMSTDGFNEAQVTALAKTQGDLKAQMIVERARSKANIHAILTDEQRAQIEDLREQRGKRWK